jgi:hypothetical protein
MSIENPMIHSIHKTVRWKIGFLLCLASALNYIDRSILAILAPAIQQDLKWLDVVTQLIDPLSVTEKEAIMGGAADAFYLNRSGK